MPLVVADRVQETTTTTGTGTVTLAGAATGYQSFAAIGNGNTTYYAIVGLTEWEVGIGTYTSSGTTLSRDTVLASSAGGVTKVDFSAGVKNVFCSYPAAKAILDGYGTLPVANGGTGATSLTANNVLLGNGTSALQVVAPGTSGNVLTSNGTTWTSAAATGVGSSYQEFLASGTWTKPAGVTWVYIEAVGGGGGGGNRTATGTNNQSGGGGGGAFNSKIVLASTLTATVTVTIGAGGTGGANASNANGNPGGDTTFGSYLTAKGGGAGQHAATTGTAYGGISGDGVLSFAATGFATNPTTTALGGYGSAAGGWGSGSEQNAQIGGSCTKGGAGGGGVEGTAPTARSGGTSVDGGNGGAANATLNTKGGNGSVPGGGGGGSINNGGGGNGADGRVRVWAW